MVKINIYLGNNIMEPLRKGLNVCVQKLSLGLVWRELQVFSKLLYRGRNQHRRDRCYQKLTRVSKELRVYQEVALANHVKKLVKLVSSSRSVSESLTAEAAALASKLVDSGKFVIKLLEFVQDTFREVDDRLCMSLFIPFNVLMASSLSRIWYCLRYHLLAISETYGAVKQGLLSSYVKFLPSLAAYLGKKQSRTYLTLSNGQKSHVPKISDDLGTAVGREYIKYRLPVSVQSTDMTEHVGKDREILDEIKDTTCRNDLRTLHHVDLKCPTYSSDVDLNESALTETATVTNIATTSNKRRDRRRRRRKANLLMFRFHRTRQKSVQICLRHRQLIASLCSKTLLVMSAKFNHVRHLPTGACVASRFSLSLTRQKRRPSHLHHRHPPTYVAATVRAHGGGGGALEREHTATDKLNQRQWLEMERNRLNQRSARQISSSSISVQQLQRKLTEELDSAAVATDTTVAMETDSEHMTNHSLTSNKLVTNRTSDEIDDIFVALERL